MLRRRRRLRNAPPDSVPSRCRRRDHGFGPALIDDRTLAGPCGNSPASQPRPQGCCLMARSPSSPAPNTWQSGIKGANFPKVLYGGTSRHFRASAKARLPVALCN